MPQKATPPIEVARENIKIREQKEIEPDKAKGTSKIMNNTLVFLFSDKRSPKKAVQIGINNWDVYLVEEYTNEQFFDNVGDETIEDYKNSCEFWAEVTSV